jgi:hypothetical protein
LSLREKCLWEFAFGLGLPPQLELVEILGGYSTFGNSIEEMLT